MDTKEKLGWAIGLALIPFAIAWNLAFYHLTPDGAWIVLRYAFNLASGFGLVNNPGGPHEQGYSCFLYVVLTGAIGKLGGLHVIYAAKIIGIAGQSLVPLLCILAGFSALRVLPGAPSRWVLIPFALAIGASALFSNYAAYWAASALETQFYAFMVMMLLCAALKFIETQRRDWLYAIAFLAFAIALTRPEGAYYFIAVEGIVLVFLLLSGRFRQMLSAFEVLAALLMVMVGYIAWNKFYFGDFFSNPFFVKMSAVGQWKNPWSHIREYAEARGWVFAGWLAVSALIVGAEGLFVIWRRDWRSAAVLATLTAFALAEPLFAVLIAHDDYTVYSRLLSPGLPAMLVFGYVGTVIALRHIAQGRTEFLASIGLVGVAALNIYAGVIGERINETLWPQTAFKDPLVYAEHLYAEPAKIIQDAVDGDPAHPYADAGDDSVVFFVKGTGLDMTGLNTRNIARSLSIYPSIDDANSAASDYVLANEPSIIATKGVMLSADGNLIPSGKPNWFFSPYEASSFFLKYYFDPMTVPYLVDPQRNEWAFFRRKDIAPKPDRLETSNIAEFRENLMHGFVSKDDKIFADPVARVLLPYEPEKPVVCVEGAVQGSQPIFIQLRQDWRMVGDDLMAEQRVSGDFKLCARVNFRKLRASVPSGTINAFLLSIWTFPEGQARVNPQEDTDSENSMFELRAVYLDARLGK